MVFLCSELDIVWYVKKGQVDQVSTMARRVFMVKYASTEILVSIAMSSTKHGYYSLNNLLRILSLWGILLSLDAFQRSAIIAMHHFKKYAVSKDNG